MRELIAYRSPTAKLFRREDGLLQAEVTEVPQHFMRGGKLHNINLRPRLDRGSFLIDRAPYVLQVSATAPAYRYQGQTGKIIVELLDVPDDTSPIFDGHSFVWAGIARDSDFLITPGLTGCGAYLRLMSPDAPRSWRYRISGGQHLLRPLVGRDASGRMLELVERRDGEILHVGWTGRVASQDDLRRGRGWGTEPSYPVLIDPTVDEIVGASGDDASVDYAGAFTATYTSIRAYNSFGYTGSCGVRFQTVNVPNASTITSATLTLRYTEAPSGSVTVYGIDTDDLAAFSNAASINSAPQTTASAVFSGGSSGADKSVDVTSIVQEIVNRAGWVANNDMGFVWPAPGSGNSIGAQAYDGSSTLCARLSITYAAAGGAVPVFVHHRKQQGIQ
jgi:hypothetical protein